MSPREPSPSKLCAVCGENCADRPRVKDQRGQYYCRECHDKKMGRKPTATTRPPLAPAASKPLPPMPESSAPDLDMGLLDAMSVAESTADSVDQARRPCPSCGTPIPVDAVVCMGCGFNSDLGRRMGEAQYEEAPSASRTTASGKQSTGRASSRSTGGAGFMSGGKEWLAGAIPAAIFLVLFLVAKSNPDTAIIFHGLQSLFGIGVGLCLLVTAFGESAGQGFLCLCVPFYALYFVYGRQESVLLKWAVAGSIFGSILGSILSVGQ